jgi:hypothetical protein
MRETVKKYLPAIACAAIPILCYVVVRPFAEIGINDDWSYVGTAQVLAQSGHLGYNGWGSPMLGWQAYFGALFIQLFGFSFTIVRFTTVVEAVLAVFLFQRTLVRAGLNSWNATLATITLALSPLCLPLDFTFMNDVPGLLVIVVCLYMCLRAVKANSQRSASIWICMAVVLNVVGGTTRQIAWLGVLVMIPCAILVLRRSLRVLLLGGLSCAAGWLTVLLAVRWLARQPYSVPESAIPGRIDLHSLKFVAGLGLNSAGFLALLAMPVLLMFAESVRSWNRRSATVFGAGMLACAIPMIVSMVSGRKLAWTAPFFHDYMTDSTFERLTIVTARDLHLAVADDCLRILLTALAVLGALSLLACLFAERPPSRNPEPRTDSVSWRTLAVVLGPFTLAYILLLASVGLQFVFYDRHLLPLLAILLLVATRLYQERVRTNLPFACIVLCVIFGIFSLVATHDRFSSFRGYAAAIDEVRSSGVPASAILGPWEFEGWTQIETVGHVNNPRVQVPKGAYVALPVRSYPPACDSELVSFLDMTPALKPAYAVSPDPAACGGRVAFAPVIYHTWVSPRTHAIFAVRLPHSFLNGTDRQEDSVSSATANSW